MVFSWADLPHDALTRVPRWQENQEGSRDGGPPTLPRKRLPRQPHSHQARSNQPKSRARPRWANPCFAKPDLALLLGRQKLRQGCLRAHLWQRSCLMPEAKNSPPTSNFLSPSKWENKGSVHQIWPQWWSCKCWLQVLNSFENKWINNLLFLPVEHVSFVYEYLHSTNGGLAPYVIKSKEAWEDNPAAWRCNILYFEWTLASTNQLRRRWTRPASLARKQRERVRMSTAI